MSKEIPDSLVQLASILGMSESTDAAQKSIFRTICVWLSVVSFHILRRCAGSGIVRPPSRQNEG